MRLRPRFSILLLAWLGSGCENPVAGVDDGGSGDLAAPLDLVVLRDLRAGDDLIGARDLAARPDLVGGSDLAAAPDLARPVALTMAGDLSSSCADGVQGGSETDVDCGGSCPPCAVGRACVGNGDCASAHCFGGFCFSGPVTFALRRAVRYPLPAA